MSLIIKKLKIIVEHGRVVTTLNIIKTLNILFSVVTRRGGGGDVCVCVCVCVWRWTFWSLKVNQAKAFESSLEVSFFGLVGTPSGALGWDHLMTLNHFYFQGDESREKICIRFFKELITNSNGTA
jgi:hypothetical protein